MIRNYIKIAWRNIVRNKAYAALNTVGLALGICACIVIFLIAQYEFSFDRFHPEKDRIYRIVGEMQRLNGEKEFLNSVYSDIAGVENDIPGFEAKAGIYYYDAKINVPGKGEALNQFEGGNGVVVTWPQYFDIFHYDWLAGNASTALKEPYTVVLSEKRARQYFGDISPDKLIGRTLIYNDSLQLSVSGIVKDWTARTDFGFTDMISINTVVSNSFLKKEIPAADWTALRPHASVAFVKLSEQTSADKVNADLMAYAKKMGRTGMYGRLAKLELQPLTDIHFAKTSQRGDDGDGFRKAYLPTLYGLMGMALFILLIAAINFINLSTAQSIQRTKEIGIRKVMGGSRASLILQFLAETLVLSLFAVVLSVLLVNPVLSLFRSFIPSGVVFNPFAASTLLFLFVITVLTALLAGFYPAKVLSGYLPVLSLKGEAVQTVTGKPGLRKALIVFQFTCSLIFIIGTLVISDQISFMQKKDKGFKPDQIVTISSWTDKIDKLEVLANKLRAVPGVETVIIQAMAPMGFGDMSAVFKYKGKQETELEVSAKVGDENFVPFYGMKIIAGRNMLHSDSLRELVINESCARALGFTSPADAVGQLLYNGDKAYPICGVVRDFHLASLREPIRPAVIEHVPEWQRGLAVKLKPATQAPGEVKATIAKMEAAWKQVFPDEGFSHSFLKDSITWLYEKEEQASWLMNAAMLITIFISCMGVFGLAMFTAKRRTKEIGIRKILGASVLSITKLLSKDFLVLVLLAILVASPIAWYFMNQWLQGFAFRTNISAWVFIVAGLAAIVIAILTVSFQAIKAAVSNPVDSLRTE